VDNLLEGAELDLAVARAEILAGQLDIRLTEANTATIRDEQGIWVPFRPSSSWAHAGPIIERAGIAIALAAPHHWTSFTYEDPSSHHGGRTPLVAAMRAYVARQR
jgi:hypothetical protein